MFCYLRKKEKIYLESCVKFTTSDNLFDQRLQDLYAKYLSKEKDNSLVCVDHCVSEYILEYFMFYNKPWFEVDHILFPIHIVKQKHWVLVHLSFKDRCLYVYDSMRGATHDRGVLEILDCYNILLPLFLDVVDFGSKRTDLDVTSGPYASKKLTDPFSVCWVDNLPSQETK